MLTLTLNPKTVVGETTVYISDCWNKLRLYLEREFGKKLSYIRVIEYQKGTGQAHYHILVDRFIPFNSIRAIWKRVSNQGSVDIRLIDIHRVKSYLTKYLTKDILINVPKDKKRYVMSRDIKIGEKIKSAWVFVKRSFEEIYSLAMFKGIVEKERYEEGRVSFFITPYSLLESIEAAYIY